jgi:hypothetical protein
MIFDSLGINLGFLELQLLALALCAPVFLAVAALFSLRKAGLAGAALGIWALVICAFPYLGAIAYWIVRPRGIGTRG